MCATGVLSRQWWGEGGLACMKAFIFEHPVNQLIEKYFKKLKTKNFTNEGSFGTETHQKKNAGLQCFERYQSAFNPRTYKEGRGGGRMPPP